MSDEPRDDAPEEQEEELRQVTQKELTEILKLHKPWAESGGDEGERADLRRCDLQKAKLQQASLQKANLWEASLQEAKLKGANLQNANLWEANLQGANLWEANLQA